MTPSDVKKLLADAGFPDNSIMYALAQACFESGGMTFESAVNTEDNNLTGITYAGSNVNWQKNCIRGIAKPAGEAAGYYAHFATLEDWATDFKRIVHAQFNQPGMEWNTEGRPIEATDLATYVHRLKLNHYFEGNEAAYLEGLQYYLDQLNPVV